MTYPYFATRSLPSLFPVCPVVCRRRARGGRHRGSAPPRRAAPGADGRRGSRDGREPPPPKKGRVSPRSSGSRDSASGAGEDEDGRTAVGLGDHAATEAAGRLAARRGGEGPGTGGGSG